MQPAKKKREPVVLAGHHQPVVLTAAPSAASAAPGASAATWQTQVIHERCEADLLYEILVHPTAATVDPLLTTCLDMVCKRYELQASLRWSTAKQLCLHTLVPDMDLKVFRILFALAWMPEVRALILRAIDPQHRGCLWPAERVEPHVDTLIDHLKRMFDGILGGDTNELSLPWQVPWVVAEARRLYVMV